jgi:hypothetical protein
MPGRDSRLGTYDICMCLDVHSLMSCTGLDDGDLAYLTANSFGGAEAASTGSSSGLKMTFAKSMFALPPTPHVPSGAAPIAVAAPPPASLRLAFAWPPPRRADSGAVGGAATDPAVVPSNQDTTADLL